MGFLNLLVLLLSISSNLPYFQRIATKSSAWETKHGAHYQSLSSILCPTRQHHEFSRQGKFWWINVSRMLDYWVSRKKLKILWRTSTTLHTTLSKSYGFSFSLTQRQTSCPSRLCTKWSWLIAWALSHHAATLTNLCHHDACIKQKRRRTF